MVSTVEQVPTLLMKLHYVWNISYVFVVYQSQMIAVFYWTFLALCMSKICLDYLRCKVFRLLALDCLKCGSVLNSKVLAKLDVGAYRCPEWCATRYKHTLSSIIQYMVIAASLESLKGLILTFFKDYQETIYILNSLHGFPD